MTNKEYGEYIKTKAPPSKLYKNMLMAFIIGGIICCIGQGITAIYAYFGAETQTASAATGITMIFLGAFLTGLGVYDNIARYGGAGTLVPITGFANAVVSPAVEFKSEGIINGMCAKMFAIAGPVIVFGILASVVYGLLLVLFGM